MGSSLSWSESLHQATLAQWGSGEVLAPWLYTFGLYGVRYAVVASVFYAIAKRGWGRPLDARYPAGDNRPATLHREWGYAALSCVIFGAINAALFGSGAIEHTQMYWELTSPSRGWGWLAASVVLALLLHDTLFYWLHRAMHTRLLYRRTHLLHHRSVRPTAFTAYSFHPLEALGEGLLVVVILFVIPMHPFAVFVFQSVSILINAYGHCARELYPADWHQHPLGRWINTSTLHQHHHASGHDNYGLYFTFWDRWMQTAVIPASARSSGLAPVASTPRTPYEATAPHPVPPRAADLEPESSTDFAAI